MQYIGRFAPSPSGPLHIGSLLAAVASYIHARQSNGQWLVRIEDIDPPREMPGAVALILETLDAFELFPDQEVFYQSTRLGIYQQVAQEMINDGLAYRCSCSRRDIRAKQHISSGEYRYPGTCRSRNNQQIDTSVRALTAPSENTFRDALQGVRDFNVHDTVGDYVIFRRDGLPAYHLAVVLDDAAQAVTHVVRGVDLLDTTGLHIHLQQTLNLPTPEYIHVPILVNSDGQKLSKRAGAEPVAATNASSIAPRILSYLGQEVPAQLHGSKPGKLWEWAIENGDFSCLKGKMEIAELPNVDE
jgi:glutamyl-Q tRNA(Asp) synthetase